LGWGFVLWVIGYALTLAIPLCRLEAPITLGHSARRRFQWWRQPPV